jgi:hypothetical protein
MELEEDMTEAGRRGATHDGSMKEASLLRERLIEA